MTDVTGLVLAGGQGSRMGGVDKGLQVFRGKPMVAHVIERFAPQVDELLINANRNPEAYGRFGHRVIADEIDGFAGPLAGFERGLAHATGNLVMTVPCDSPFLPLDLVERLRCRARTRNGATRRRENRRPGASRLLAHAPRRALVIARLPRLGPAQDRQLVRRASRRGSPFDDEAEAFLNINTREELANLEPRG